MWHDGQATEPNASSWPHFGHWRITEWVSVDKSGLQASAGYAVRSIDFERPCGGQPQGDAYSYKKDHEADQAVQGIAQLKKWRCQTDEDKLHRQFSHVDRGPWPRGRRLLRLAGARIVCQCVIPAPRGGGLLRGRSCGAMFHA